jgi:phosphatidate phosphatase PAH1
MKVGETGEAFFVFETDADVPADLQTSPLAGPVSDDELEQKQNEDQEQPGVRSADLFSNGAAADTWLACRSPSSWISQRRGQTD